ncbi:MAG: hypothetical protein ACKO27_13360 [Ilumatobacteraceae bacterium]
MRTSPENAIDTVRTGGTVVDVEVDDVEEVEVDAGAVGGTSATRAVGGTVGAPALPCEHEATTTSASNAT